MKIWLADGHPILDADGKPILCDECPCCDSPSEEPDPNNCCASVACLEGMLAIVHLDFQFADGYNWPVMNADYPIILTSSGSDDLGCFLSAIPTDAVRDALAERFFAATGIEEDRSSDIFELDFRCNSEGSITVSLTRITGTADGGVVCGAYGANGDMPLTPISNGQEIELFPLPGTGRCVGDLPAPALSSAIVTLYGKPCGGDPDCPDGPTADFTYDNVAEDAGLDACDPLHPPADIYTGCSFALSTTVTPGTCPVVGCFWSDGVSSCDRMHFSSTEECGAHYPELTLYVVDEQGCIFTVTHALDCCNCCPAFGQVGFDGDTIPDGFDPYQGGEICGESPFQDHCHIIEFFQFLLLPGIATDCEGIQVNSVRYSIEWDGLLDRDGNPLIDGCYDAGTIFRFRFDAGLLGRCFCIRFTPFDLLGCVGESIVYKLTTSHSPEDCSECPNTQT